MTAAILLGGTTGMGVLLLLSGLAPARLPLHRALARLDEAPPPNVEFPVRVEPLIVKVPDDNDLMAPPLFVLSA